MKPPWARPPSVILVAGLAFLIVFGALCGRMAWTTSATFDEPGFIVAGYSYHRSHTAEICTTNLRLLPWWLAAPLRLFNPSLPEGLTGKPRLIVTGDLELGRAFLADPRNDGVALLRASRCANILLGAALGAVLFFWSRRLYGDTGGLFTLGLYCLNPVVISNSAIATSDLGASLLFVVAVAAIWRLLHRVNVARVILCGLALGALATAKLSWFLIFPVAAVLLAIRLGTVRRFETSAQNPSDSNSPRLMSLFGAGACVVVIAYLALWAVYGFRFTPGEPLPDDAWVGSSPQASLYHRLIATAHGAHLLPEGYLFDLQTFALTGSGRRAFLAGEYSLDGWWYFFPVVWFLKSPLPFVAALLLALVATLFPLLRNPNRATVQGKRILLPLAVLGVIYTAVAMAGRLNIGIRHLLPAYPLLFVFAGSLGQGNGPGFRRVMLIATIGWSALEAAVVHPEYLAYINIFGGGASRGYQVLADSSYDWGQDLSAFERWLNARAGAAAKSKVYFSYFGNADLTRLRDRVVLLPQYVETRPATVYALGAGTYVLSSTMLQTLYGPQMGPWRPRLEEQFQNALHDVERLQSASVRDGLAGFDALMAENGTAWWEQRIMLFDHYRFNRLCAWLRQRQPSGRITRTLLVYELTDDDLRAAILGPPAEMRINYQIKGDVP